MRAPEHPADWGEGFGEYPIVTGRGVKADQEQAREEDAG